MPDQVNGSGAAAVAVHLPFTPEQTLLQGVLTIAFASASILSTLLALEWYRRLEKRPFRQTLIMMLLVSNLIKAICFVTYPSTIIARGTGDGLQAFCTVTGFFINFGNEGGGTWRTSFHMHSSPYFILLLS